MHSVFVGPAAPFFFVTNSNTFQFENSKTSVSNDSESNKYEWNTSSDEGYLEQIIGYFSIFTYL